MLSNSRVVAPYTAPRWLSAIAWDPRGKLSSQANRATARTIFSDRPAREDPDRLVPSIGARRRAAD